MARRRRTGMVGFDQKIVQDVGLAALAVRILPMIVYNFFPLNPNLYTVVGTGAGYLTGTFLKNKTLANASIALGLVEFIAPAIENMVSGFGGGGFIPAVAPGTAAMLGPPSQQSKIADYINLPSLNDYTNDPSQRLGIKEYRDYY